MARFIARLKVSFFCIIFTDSLLYIAGLWLSMSPGTGASHFGIWGLYSWLSMSPGTGALNVGSGGLSYGYLCPQGLAPLTLGSVGYTFGYPCPQGLAPLLGFWGLRFDFSVFSCFCLTLSNRIFPQLP